MQRIIPPINRKLILEELTGDRFVRKTNKAGNLLYIINGNNAPNVLREIGRLREVAFRTAGGGTGKDCDLDDFDTGENAYEQLIVWDPDQQEILGGYRFLICNSNTCSSDIGEKRLATSKLFNFSDEFRKNYLPHMIELGRSFVQPMYQSTNLKRKGLYSLDNLWDGLGTLVLDHPDTKYFFGKVTMYLHYHQEARDMILFFLHKHFPDKDKLVVPREPLRVVTDQDKLNSIFTGKDYIEDYKILSREVRALGETIPPLINAYMSLSPSMRSFGTVLNHSFGDVEETGIMITVNDLYKSKVERHLSNYVPKNLRRISNISIRNTKLNALYKRFKFNKHEH
ncbi:MAG: GNAT family N-acetyltransferase [Bacteroidales bacterium]|nr:GNAT family N-acetyltransferase [Bacteroidales bacterium]